MVKIVVTTDLGEVSITRNDLNSQSTWMALAGVFFDVLHGMEFSYLPDGDTVEHSIREYAEFITDNKGGVSYEDE